MIYPNKAKINVKLLLEYIASAVLSHLIMISSATLWTLGHQATLCMEFSSHEYWSGLPFPFPTIAIV